MDIKKPLGPWACAVSLGGGTTPKPPQCKAGNYSLYKNACWKGIFPKTVTADTAGDCCAASASGKYSKFTYFAQNKVRATLSLYLHSYIHSLPPPTHTVFHLSNYHFPFIVYQTLHIVVV